MSTDTDTVSASTQYFSESMWSDPKVLKVMGKRPRWISFQVKRDRFVKNVQNMASWDRYKDSHKQSTLMWQEIKKIFSSIVTPKPEKIVLNTYLNASITIEKYYKTGQVLKRPVFLKVGSGPGRLSKSEENIDFRSRMWEHDITIN